MPRFVNSYFAARDHKFENQQPTFSVSVVHDVIRAFTINNVCQVCTVWNERTRNASLAYANGWINLYLCLSADKMIHRLRSRLMNENAGGTRARCTRTRLAGWTLRELLVRTAYKSNKRFPSANFLYCKYIAFILTYKFMASYIMRIVIIKMKHFSILRNAPYAATS